jgi:ketosteroid isomerase-like protein
MLGLVLALGACARVTAPVTDVAADEAAIRKVLDDVASTFNAGNYDGMFALYRDDVVVSGPGAPDIVGKQAWRDGLASSLPPGMAFKMRFDTQEMAIAGDLAYERGTYSIEVTDKATGKVVPAPLGGRHIHIFKREADGSWKGWRLMENSPDPVPAAPPAPAKAP